MNRPIGRSIRFTKLMAISLAIWLLLLAIITIYTQLSLNIAIDRDIKLDRSSIIDITETNSSLIYFIMENKGIYLLYFKQVDCPGCKILEPGLMRYISEQRLNITLVQIYIDFIFKDNMDKAFEIMSFFKVYGTPTLILYKDGFEINRQVGIFNGDQYEGLKNFVENSLQGRSIQGAILNPLYWIIDLMSRYIVFFAPAIGFVASISPCSLPMIAAFSVSYREKSIRLLKTLVTMLILTVPAALGLAYISIYGADLFGISIYYSILLYIGVLLLLWGLLSVLNVNVISSIRSRYMLPILGLQCSSPFLFMIIALASRNIALAIASTILFSLGYVVPYIASLKFMSDMFTKIIYGRKLHYLQGAILLAVAIYLLLESYNNILITTI